MDTIENNKMTPADRIRSTCNELADFLIEKNQAYGNSALEPIRIFSKGDNKEQLRTRIDDKLARIMRGHEYQTEDTVKDLAGYLILLMIAEKED
jgi:hypothetical protein